MTPCPHCSGANPKSGCCGGLLDRVTDQGGALVVSGGPGIGKSALLGEAVKGARERGMLVLKVTGVQSEAVLPFAGLHSLLQPLLGRVDALGAPQRDAVLAAFGMTDAAVPDPFLTALAALDLMAEAAARAPVLVVADDAHWLDQATRDALTFVARRLEFEPILLVAAIRDGYETPLREAGLPSVALGALDPPTAAALLDSRSPGCRRACASVSCARRREIRWRWWNCRSRTGGSAARMSWAPGMSGMPDGCR